MVVAWKGHPKLAYSAPPVEDGALAQPLWSPSLAAVVAVEEPWEAVVPIWRAGRHSSFGVDYRDGRSGPFLQKCVSSFVPQCGRASKTKWAWQNRERQWARAGEPTAGRLRGEEEAPEDHPCWSGAQRMSRRRRRWGGMEWSGVEWNGMGEKREQNTLLKPQPSQPSYQLDLQFIANDGRRFLALGFLRHDAYYCINTVLSFY